MTTPSTVASKLTEEDRAAWLEANAARCERLHPKADCHKRYRRNAAEMRALLQHKDEANG